MDFLLHACDVAKSEAGGHWYLGLFAGAVFALITTDISLAMRPRYRSTTALCPSLVSGDSYPAYQPSSSSSATAASSIGKSLCRVWYTNDAVALDSSSTRGTADGAISSKRLVAVVPKLKRYGLSTQASDSQRPGSFQ